MITDNPLNDAISEMNRLDSLEGDEPQYCYMCEEYKHNCEYVFKRWYCPQCLNELKIENQIN